MSKPVRTVAVVGLGTMGAPMAANLLHRGFRVVCHNRARVREEPLREAGAETAASPALAAARADALLICVSDTPDVEEVLFAPERGAIHGLMPGSLVIDCSTIAPEAARRAWTALSERGVGFVDAPVSGGSEGARAGTLAIMCGGTEEDFERAKPVLGAIGKAVIRVGPPGAGQVAKAVNQVIIAGTYQAVAEGFTLSARLGVDPRAVLSAIEKGAAQSWILTNRGPNVINDAYPLGFRMRLHRKDLRIALAAAEKNGVTMPLAALVATVEDGLIGLGYGDEDVSAVARAVRRASGLEDGPMPAPASPASGSGD
jgi:3-hydroxyisobutyrate dehydrogenase